MDSYKKLIFNNFDQDIWHYLKSSDKPILIYGMGNGADKIISVFEKYGIKYSDVFASDGFVRGHSYRGKLVISYSEACARYGNDINIVVSFGSKLPQVMDYIFSLENKHSVFAPDVPVCEGEIFNEEFFDSHLEELFEARNSLSDQKSKDIFDDIIRFKLTGRLRYLKSTATDEKEEEYILKFSEYETFVDLGAYNGDTVRKYLNLCQNMKVIYAFEPDKRNFKKLFSYCHELNSIKAIPLNLASYSRKASLEFSSSGNRNSSASSQGSYQNKIVIIDADAPDNICSSADFIKFDVEGLERESLLGCKRLISTYSPDLLVSMYHKSEDMYDLPLLVKKLNQGYSLYLRRNPYIPAWDLNLYAIK